MRWTKFSLKILIYYFLIDKLELCLAVIMFHIYVGEKPKLCYKLVYKKG